MRSLISKLSLELDTLLDSGSVCLYKYINVSTPNSVQWVLWHSAKSSQANLFTLSRGRYHYCKLKNIVNKKVLANEMVSTEQYSSVGFVTGGPPSSLMINRKSIGCCKKVLTYHIYQTRLPFQTLKVSKLRPAVSWWSNVVFMHWPGSKVHLLRVHNFSIFFHLKSQFLFDFLTTPDTTPSQ